MIAPTSHENHRQFELPGRITVLEGNGELPKLELTTDWSTAEIYLQGAHITDFQKRGEEPLLFTSRCSRFLAGQPIRGGVPVIFPWFGSREGEPAHGFARLAAWRLQEATAIPEGGVSLRFSLPEAPARATWPEFSANYIITVTDRLAIELIITNLSPGQPLIFENCLHTYFNVGDINATTIRGLQGVGYLDKTQQFAQKTEANEAIRITEETDRIYLNTTTAVEIVDEKLRRRIQVNKRGSASTVVWNPWSAKAQAMPDFCNEDYLTMVCVESGNVAENKLSLPPGRSAVLQVEYSSTAL